MFIYIPGYTPVYGLADFLYVASVLLSTCMLFAAFMAISIREGYGDIVSSTFITVPGTIGLLYGLVCAPVGATICYLIHGTLFIIGRPDMALVVDVAQVACWLVLMWSIFVPINRSQRRTSCH